MKQPVLKQIREYERANLQAARIIAAEPQKHGGEGSLAVWWARRILGKAEPQCAP